MRSSTVSMAPRRPAELILQLLTQVLWRRNRSSLAQFIRVCQRLVPSLIMISAAYSRNPVVLFLLDLFTETPARLKN